MRKSRGYQGTLPAAGCLVLGLLGIGCTTAAEQEETVRDKVQEMRDASTTDFTGTMRWIELEGGFWGIITASGGKYLPTQALPEAVQKEGMPVRGTLRLRKGVMTIQMWGSPVEVVTIEPAP